MNMKRMFSGLQRRVSTFPNPTQSQGNTSPSSSGNESPEEIIIREIKAFCEAGGGPNSVANDYLHLPAIVEAAESSATAAKEAAVRIRKYLSYPAKPQGAAQYNAIMLVRILAENPGHTFTRNIDSKFVNTVKELLREGRDIPAQHMLRETLDMFELQKTQDEDLVGLIAMWKKEKARAMKYAPSPAPYPMPMQQPGFGHGYGHGPRPRQLPPPDELAGRISEARTSANLLIQLAQSTPAAEVQDHELMKEFSERCHAAARSIQGYMAAENPGPDEDTMLTLIETNEHLSVALSKYQRAVLNARKAVGGANANRATVNGQNGGSGTATPNGQATPYPPTETPRQGSTPPLIEPVPSLPPLPSTEEVPLSDMVRTDMSSISIPPPAATTTAVAPQAAPRRYEYNANDFQVENPFADSAADDEHDRHTVSSLGEDRRHY